MTESLAGPLIEATRRSYEDQLASKDAESAVREAAVREREAALAKAKQGLDAQVAETLRQERGAITAEESRKAKLEAKLELATDLDRKAKEIDELQEVLKLRDAKLAQSQKAEAELLRKQRELDDTKREFELTIEKRIQEGLDVTRAQARKEAEEQLNLKVLEKEQTIQSMKGKIEELQRRAEQGSQQLQGEVLELELEALLRARFPFDSIEPVPKGEYGGDVIHQVKGQTGQACGSILWEFKRTKNWSDSWLAKLRGDQRVAKAETSVLVSYALPKGVESFDLIEGVWVTYPRAAVPVALALRHALIDVAIARKAAEGQQGKMEMVYHYLTGSGFRQRVQAIAEAFRSMQEDLDREKKVITKQWAKREQQIDQVMQATSGMWGDLQGIAGKTLNEIEGLSLEAIAGPDPGETK